MATEPTPLSPPSTQGSPYCADPNCKFCNELRKTQHQVAIGKPIEIPKSK